MAYFSISNSFAYKSSLSKDSYVLLLYTFSKNRMVWSYGVQSSSYFIEESVMIICYLESAMKNNFCNILTVSASSNTSCTIVFLIIESVGILLTTLKRLVSC